ncbi:hypothetical protein KAK07_07535 [Ideonella sp. 4Y16]|uniref:hypothetical protein n=1 Tax=Ideonella alba TaxID=2824118 RepID=UPI001B366DCD|nr:hypothetical protein [Ideonella alba]MBQ0943185.1 hypothetical protein [Ideonella alba]
MDWSVWDIASVRKVRSLADLDKAYGSRDDAWDSLAEALGKLISTASDTAAKQAKAKDAAKPTLEACKDIIAEAQKHQKRLDTLGKELAAALKEARQALAAEQKGSEDEGDDADAAVAALFDPKRLLAQLMMCQRKPEYRPNFAFIDANPKLKKPAALCLHAKVSGRTLLRRLQDEQDIKQGCYGVAWIEDRVLNLRVDKPFSGLTKKVRGPLKACGFRVSAVVLWAEDGTALERDDEDDAATAQDETGTPPPAPQSPEVSPAPPGVSQADFMARLKALQPAIVQATGGASRDPRVAALVARMGELAKAKDFDGAMAVLRALQDMLSSRGGGGAGSPSGESPLGNEFPAKWRRISSELREASESVDEQISRLQRVLREQDDSELKEIAEFGLNAVTGNFKVPLLAAMLELGDGHNATAEDAAGARELARAYANHLRGDIRVAACDQNPFGIEVSIRDTLAAALDRFVTELS